MKPTLTLPKKHGVAVILVATIVLAASSILYELLLGQTLSAFFGNTIAQYSITIGLYMCSMGVGAYVAEGRLVEKPLTTLLWIEVILATVGGSTIILAHVLHALIPSVLAFSIAMYALIIGIGILTGAEIPLLFEVAKNFHAALEIMIMGVDYFGAFAGSIAFAFFFYTTVGLTATAFIVALGNTVAGLILYTLHAHTSATSESVRLPALILVCVTLAMLVLLLYAPHINNFLIDTLYLS
jgi:spermidine synthase